MKNMESDHDENEMEIYSDDEDESSTVKNRTIMDNTNENTLWYTREDLEKKKLAELKKCVRKDWEKTDSIMMIID